MLNFLRLLAYKQTHRLRDENIANATFTNTLNDFKPYYNQHILPKVKEYESKRIEALRSLRNRAILAFPLGISCIGIVLYIAIYKMTSIDLGVIIFATVTPVMGLVWWTLNAVRNYQTSVKEQIYPLIFGFFGDNFLYEHESPISVSSLKASKLIPSYDTEKSGDYVRGTYKNVAIELLEATMTETQGTGKNRRTVTVFKGLFITLEAPKKFKGKTIVRKDHGIMNWATNAFNKRERVKLEDPVFEKQFQVFADDQVEARYLLTTSFMDRLLKLVTLFESKGLQCSFYDSCLLLMIPTEKDYFKGSSIFKPATFVEEINIVLQEMKNLFDIIDILKLNEKTGL